MAGAHTTAHPTPADTRPAVGTAGRPGAGAGLWQRLRPSELLLNLTSREIKAQFKRTALGRLWSFINPIATLSIYTVVFGVLLKSTPPPGADGERNFTLFLAAGLIPWTFISASIMNGMSALVANSGLLTKVYFQRWTLVVSSILALANTFLIELAVVVAIMAIFIGPQVLLFIPLLLVLVAITIAFCSGIALMLSVALVYFRDTQHFMAIFMQLWFYATPIIYWIQLIQDRAPGLLFWYRANPAERLISAYRSMLYEFRVPRWDDWAWSIGWAAVALFVGVQVFRRFSARIVEEL
ncbi:ABC transporter permease [Nakamurella endophytica]|uniref:Transport permease protein n=1 Tax=Nakamurella endophytica TaxID=1748367 RepID=A0A917SXS6_9ACTN|nr:ABC transporter permease [Nakamurella endophytica]GGM01517.1 transport permease protein [Nakamurella endophytica]